MKPWRRAALDHHHSKWHRHWHWHGDPRRALLTYYVRATLHRRIFFLIGASLLINGCVVGAMGHLIGVDVHNRARSWMLLLFFVFTLWGLSGGLARRLTRPFVELARVAQEIGSGNLAARYQMHQRGRSSEAFLIGSSINEMASRIEKQLRDQRELLAAVSHEVRTPLARIRMLVELGRTRETEVDHFVVDAKTLDALDREVIEIDALVGELLASSRLDFAAVTRTLLDARDVVERAAERQTLTPTLALPEGPLPFRADPTLIQRALANLLQNAVVHAGGVDSVVVTSTDERVRFAINDRGPGLADGDETKIFDPFYRGAGASGATDTHAALGLGLALVQRIAKAHNGRAFAEKRPVHKGGGASIGFEIPRALESATSDRVTSS